MFELQGNRFVYSVSSISSFLCFYVTLIHFHFQSLLIDIRNTLLRSLLIYVFVKGGKRSLEHKEMSDREMHNIASSCSTQREVLRSLSSYYHASLFHSLNLNHLFGRNLFTVMISVMIRLHVTFLL